jgi:kinesin family protein 3/17
MRFLASRRGSKSALRAVTLAVGGGGGTGGPPRPGGGAEVIVEKEVVEVEKVVEKEVIIEKIVHTEITPDQFEAIQQTLDMEAEDDRQQAEAERQQIEQQKDLAENEKQRLLQELQHKQAQREEEANNQARMLVQLKAMEEKMLVGTQVMEKAMQQEMELKKAQCEVEQRKIDEERIKEELENQLENQHDLEDKYASAEEQVQKMTAKLEKLWHRHKSTQQDLQDLQKEFQQEREDMLETIRELRREVKLVCLTIENFVPVEHYQQIVERAHYDESTDEWVIANLELAGNRVKPQRKRILDDGESPRRGGPENQNEQAEHMMNGRPNVYFAYTEDGGAQRAESRPVKAQQKNQRTRSAGRPNTASRKGRSVKASAVGPAQMTMNNFLHSTEPEKDDPASRQFPKARGLVKAA